MTPESAAVPAARFESVAVRYGATRVLSDVSFEAPRGSVVALLGRNGAGKSSLLRCLVGLQKPSLGQVRLLGRDPWRERSALMTRVGVVPEEPDAPPHLPWPELDRLCGSFHASWDSGAVRAQLERMKVPATVPFQKLSRGQKTATLLALALGHRPEVIVLDDPTLGLDAVAKRALVGELIDTLAARGATVVVATHDFSTFERFAEHVVILGAHRMLLSENSESVQARFRRLRGPANATFAEFSTKSVADLPWGREAIVTNYTDEAFESWRTRTGEGEAAPMSLEEIFVAIAGEEAES